MTWWKFQVSLNFNYASFLSIRQLLSKKTFVTINPTRIELKIKILYFQKRMRWMVEVLGGKVTREYDPMGKIILIANMAGRDKFEV